MADENIRVKRGLVFTKGVDDAPSECDLDGLDKWDYLINNSHSSERVEDSLIDILNVIKMKVTEWKKIRKTCKEKRSYSYSAGGAEVI